MSTLHISIVKCNVSRFNFVIAVAISPPVFVPAFFARCVSHSPSSLLTRFALVFASVDISAGSSLVLAMCIFTPFSSRMTCMALNSDVTCHISFSSPVLISDLLL